MAGLDKEFCFCYVRWNGIYNMKTNSKCEISKLIDRLFFDIGNIKLFELCISLYFVFMT